MKLYKNSANAYIFDISCKGVRHKRYFSRPQTTNKHTPKIEDALKNSRFYTIKLKRFDKEKPHWAKDNHQAKVRWWLVIPTTYNQSATAMMIQMGIPITITFPKFSQSSISSLTVNKVTFTSNLNTDDRGLLDQKTNTDFAVKPDEDRPLAKARSDETNATVTSNPATVATKRQLINNWYYYVSSQSDNINHRKLTSPIAFMSNNKRHPSST